MVKEKMNQSDNKKSCDIIVITHNALKYTEKCIESILRFTKDVKYRIIFVDNDSTDNTLDYLKKVPNSILISNKDNKGFAKAMNQGLDQVTGEYTVWLNNDTIVSKGWLSRMINHLEVFHDSGAIGPMCNATGIIQREDEWESKAKINDVNEFAREYYQKNNGMVIEYHRIAGFCIVMKSELIKKVGKLDEQFNFGGYDDDDYCRRIKEAGYKILIAKDVFIYHKSGATFSAIKDPDKDLGFLMQKLRVQFLRKALKINDDEVDEKLLVSVIMPTRNRVNIIPYAISSVLNQKYKNLELIIVNDGGIDLEETIKKFSDNRIKYIFNEKSKGKSYANNIGLSHAKGEIIAYLDDDDLWYPNHLSQTVKFLTKFDSREMVYTDYVNVDAIIEVNGNQIPKRKEVVLQQEFRENPIDNMNFIPNFSVVHYKKLLAKTGEFDEKLKYYEDWDLFRRFSKKTHFVHVPYITGEYWLKQYGNTLNKSALEDPNLMDVIDYIKKKSPKNQDQTMKDLETADNFVRKRDFNQAIKIYQVILNKDPEYFPVIESIAWCYFQAKKYDLSSKYYSLAIKLNPTLIEPYINHAKCLMEKKSYSQAKEFLELALIISDDRHVYDLLQKCYKKMDNPQTAEQIRKKTLHISENINLREVETTLLKLYNKSKFWRAVFNFGYRVIQKFAD